MRQTAANQATPQTTRDSRRLSALRQASALRAGALRVPLVSNGLLVALKLAVWIITGSLGVLSEAVHSLADVIVTSMQVLSVRLAARPADHNHAYGHGKYENVSAALEAVFILATGAFVVAQAVPRLLHPAVRIASLDLGIAVMFVSAAINFVVSTRLRTAARLEQSPALHAEAAQLGADVFTAAGVGVALVAIRLTGFTIIDPIISLIVAGLIGKSAYDVSARAFVDLTDGRLPPAEETMIREIIEEHRDLFTGYHKLRTRRSGGGEFIDFHLQMRDETPLKVAHDLSDRIVVAIKDAMPRAHVLIHLEPEER